MAASIERTRLSNNDGGNSLLTLPGSNGFPESAQLRFSERLMCDTERKCMDKSSSLFQERVDVRALLTTMTQNLFIELEVTKC